MTRRFVTLCALILMHKARQFRLAGEAYVRQTRRRRRADSQFLMYCYMNMKAANQFVHQGVEHEQTEGAKDC